MNFNTKIQHLIILLLLIINILILPKANSSTTPIVYITQQYELLQPAQTCTINVTIANITNLNAWQIKLSFNPKILNCQAVYIPDDNIFRGYTTWNHSEVDNTIGYVKIFCAIQGTDSVAGSGTMCQIEFKCLTLGVSGLNFVDVNSFYGCYLQDPAYTFIPFEAIDGRIKVVPYNSQVYPFTVIQGGQIYYVNVITNLTATSLQYNEALMEMSFDITGTLYNIGFSVVEIPKKLLNNTLLILIDDNPHRIFSQSFLTLAENTTHSFPFFKHNQTQNTLKIKVRQTVPGDITGDRVTDISDVAFAAWSYGSTPAEPRWCSVADINDDEMIEITDVSFIAFYYGNSM
jgi:hypothetical protein